MTRTAVLLMQKSTYDPQTIEARWQKVWADRQHQDAANGLSAASIASLSPDVLTTLDGLVMVMECVSHCIYVRSRDLS